MGSVIHICGPGWAISSLPRPAYEQAGPIPATPQLSPLLGRAPASAAAGPCPGLFFIPATSRPRLHLGCAPARPPLLLLGGPRPGSGRGWASAPAPLRVCRAGQSSSPPVGPHRGRPVRPRPGFSWAAPGRARRLLLGRPRVIRPSQRPGHFLRDKNQLSATSLFF
jgi:hypothetical protein